MRSNSIDTANLTGIFADGRWIAADGDDLLEVVNPATERVIGYAPMASDRDVDVAVQAATRALPAWSAAGPTARAFVLSRLAIEVEARAEDFGRIVTRENGSPVQETTSTAMNAARILAYYASLAGSLDCEDLRPSGVAGLVSRVARRPVGVAGLITPWNFPLSILAMKLGPALLAGCTVVAKPAPETPLHLAVLAEALVAAEVPPGVVNLVAGGVSTGQAIVEHPGVAKIAFTGSTEAGRQIAVACARQLKPVTLELGGKSAALVLDDVDADVLRANLMRASLRNNGQTCYAATRLLLPRARYAELVDAVADVVQGAVVGDPMREETQVGPLVSDRQRQRVEDYVALGRSEGATVATGGSRPQHLPVGYYVEPTLFTDSNPGMRIAREEIFGPVLVAMPYADEDEGIAMVNDSPFGLAGMVYGDDLDRAERVACRFEAGTVGINSLVLNPVAPFGGWKESGLGVELGPEAVTPYLRYQSVTGNLR
ncbi:aldehyde dehydrogenase family protein [Nocardioides halotolerans]|uniref:aldehyde dehydrogenase family protein n=1 Tax=Nocardioides halotolerans TaxID=433660 RepID=UPI00040BB01A|nr:aldehyde dehydrogenase family protein [Nocardioides halotolerans]